MNWVDIEKGLIIIYQKLNLDLKENELNYLKEAFTFTEKLWIEQFNKIEKINFVMISEAPLFGKEQKYFYNPNSKFSSFFYFKNIEAFNVTYSKENYNNKIFVLEHLNKKGFLILDLYPLALNKHDTQINFNSVTSKEYKTIFDELKKVYLIEKLKLIKSKITSETTFFYRYKRLKKKLGGILEKELIDMNLIEKDSDLDCINNNMSIDKEKLKQIVNI